MLETFFTLFFVYAIVNTDERADELQIRSVGTMRQEASRIRESAKKCPKCCSPRVDERREKESIVTTTTTTTKWAAVAAARRWYNG